MYPEFVAIYIMLAIVIVLLAAVLFLVLKIFKNSGSTYNPPIDNSAAYYQQPYQQPYQQNYQDSYQQPVQPGSVVFCKNCATQFDASQGYCPQCGTRR